MRTQRTLSGRLKASLRTPKLCACSVNSDPTLTGLKDPSRLGKRSKILKESSIVASGIGANKTSQHFDIIIHDDMNSHKNSQTAEQRKKVIDHYRLNHSILEPNGTLVIIGTRYAADDLIGHILENEIKNDTKGLIGNSLESDRIVEPPPPLIEKLESFEGDRGVF